MNAKTAEAELNHGVSMFKKYKNLLGELTRKSIKLKYRNSWLGILWSFFQPLLNMIVLSVVFSRLLGRGGAGIICYPVYLFSGRIMYEFFVTSTKQAMTAFRRNAAIIKKVYVPKYMYPLSSILSTFVTTSISMLCYVMVWVFFKLTGISGGKDLVFSWHFLLLFVPMFIMLVFSTGIGLILSVLCVYFRDIEYIYDVFTRLLMYLLPILYSVERFKEGSKLRLVIQINPMYSMIELFRQCVLTGEWMHPKMLLYASVTALITLIIGMIVFDWKSDTIIYHL
ncbi:MAG: ABC transporter permease [Eubacterium sp.]|nr:ABC transporter permease [Eubacterium sp.]